MEGLIHINTLRDDYYVFDQDAYELRGDMTGRIFRLGQKVRVRVADADDDKYKRKNIKMTFFCHFHI